MPKKGWVHTSRISKQIVIVDGRVRVAKFEMRKSTSQLEHLCPSTSQSRHRQQWKAGQMMFGVTKDWMGRLNWVWYCTGSWVVSKGQKKPRFEPTLIVCCAGLPHSRLPGTSASSPSTSPPSKSAHLTHSYHTFMSHPTGRHASLQSLRECANESPCTKHRWPFDFGEVATLKFEGFADAKLSVAHKTRGASTGGLGSIPVKFEGQYNRELCPQSSSESGPESNLFFHFFSMASCLGPPFTYSLYGSAFSPRRRERGWATGRPLCQYKTDCRQTLEYNLTEPTASKS